MTPQIPLGSGFGPRTTARELLGDRRFDGLRVVITGGSVGSGSRPLAHSRAPVRMSALARARRPPSRAHPPEQRRDHGGAPLARRARFRIAARDQPPRPFPAHGALVAGARRRLTASPRPLRAFTRRGQANPSPSGRLDFRAKAGPPRRSEQRAIFASTLYAKCSGLVRPWSGIQIPEVELLDEARDLRRVPVERVGSVGAARHPVTWKIQHQYAPTRQPRPDLPPGAV